MLEKIVLAFKLSITDIYASFFIIFNLTKQQKE